MATHRRRSRKRRPPPSSPDELAARMVAALEELVELQREQNELLAEIAAGPVDQSALSDLLRDWLAPRRTGG